MNEPQTIGQLLSASLIRLWEGLVAYVPSVFGALIVLIVGWIVSSGLGRLVATLLSAAKLPQVMERAHVSDALKRVGLTMEVPQIVGWAVKWFFIIVSLITAADILQWGAVTTFLQTILSYVPNVIIAVFILFAGWVIAQVVSTVVLHAVTVSHVMPATMLATIAKWAIMVFSGLAALAQLGIATELIQILFTGFVFMVALAGGLAFGLAGKEQAVSILERIRRSFF